MGLLDIHAEGLKEAYNRQLRTPGPAHGPESFSAWAALQSIGGKAEMQGALESAASTSDLLSGFGTALASTGGAEGMFSTGSEADAKQREQARQRLLNSDAFDTSAGNILRRRADEWAPDPETSHAANQIIHGLTRGVSKAVGDIVTMGPVAGSAAFGLDEGNNATQRLRMKGIPTPTAAKVGIVTGIASGLTAGIPAVGPTVATTIGLGLATGPGAYMAQEALTRDILQRAGHNDEASLHDPLDPLGLSLSIALPAVIGGLHIRGIAKRAEKAPGLPLDQLRPAELAKLKYNDPRLDAYAAQAAEAHGVPAGVLLGIKNAGEKSNADQTSPAGAKGIMQFMPATAKEMGLAYPTDPVASINAGAAYMRKLYDAYGSWDAAVAHYNGGGAQAAIVRGGGKPTIPETAAYLERVKKYAADPAVVDAARVRVTDDALMRSMPEHPEARAEVLKASDEVAAGRMPDVAPAPHNAAVATSDDVVGNSQGGHSADDRLTSDAHALASGFVSEVERLAEQHGTVYVRWSPSAERDLTPGSNSRDFVSGQTHAGLSAVEITKDTHPVDIAKALAEYGFLRMQDSRSSPRVYLGQRIGTDTDSHALIRPTKMLHEVPADVVAALDKGFDKVVDLQDDIARDTARLTRISDAGAKAITERDLAAKRLELSKLFRELQEPTVTLTIGERNGVPIGRDAANALPPATATTIKPEPLQTATRETNAPSLDALRVTQLAEESPDLKVRLPGSDETLTVGEALTRAKEEAANEASEADLVKAAVNCFLSFGA